MQSFLDGRVTLHGGDNRDVLRTIASNSLDSIVTDPPYAFVSIVKRFGKATATPASGHGAYARASAGFMGKQWDTGEVAFDTEFWRECLRVLKPGGHVAAFSATRTYHRLAVAIEDAGFEIRDQIAWAYGSGFPKSHDVAKGIDKKRDDRAAVLAVTAFVAEAAERAGRSRGDIDAHMGTSDMAAWWTSRLMHRCQCPNLEQWVALKAFLEFGDEMDTEVTRLNSRKGAHSDVWNHAPVVGEYPGEPGGFGDHRFAIRDNKIRATSEVARNWQGWGTAIKPAWEPICLGRKPLAGTVAENVLEHGVGAVNIDGCRADGRFPANILHDGSAEVIEAFAVDETGSSAARFFYTAKADAHDRAGSNHPTVKPVNLMQWLVRLVTPKGGTTLDPFAGTGTTGEAAFREGCCAILIEREAEYQADIARRMALALAGPDERKRESIKAKEPEKPFEADSLFANL